MLKGRYAVPMMVGNFSALLISMIGMGLITKFFGVGSLGQLGIVTSLTMVVTPFVTFRLDLIIERESKASRRAVVAAGHFWAAIVALFIFALGGAANSLHAHIASTILKYLSLNVFLYASFTLCWSWLVAERHMAASVALQVMRAILSAALPLLIHNFSSLPEAVLLGSAMSQIVAIPIGLYCLAENRNELVRSIRSAVLKHSDLLIPNSAPLFLNQLSIYVGPLLLGLFGSTADVGVFWFILRIVLMPASIIADPLRRSAFAAHTSLSSLSAADLTRYSRWSMMAAAASLGAACLAILLLPFAKMFGGFVPTEIFHFRAALFLAVLWVGGTIGNASIVGLIPTFRFGHRQSVYEMIGLLTRAATIMLGALGIAATATTALYFCAMVTMNYGWAWYLFNRGRRLVLNYA